MTIRCWLSKNVWRQSITRTKGEAWKLTDKVVEEMRETRYLGLLQRK